MWVLSLMLWREEDRSQLTEQRNSYKLTVNSERTPESWVARARALRTPAVVSDSKCTI